MADPRYEGAFRSAVLNPAVPTPAGLASAFGGMSVKRFDVYRNNVTASLAKALADIFPAVRRIVGDERFAEIAILFARANPPRSPLLFRYGTEFPDFIEHFEPASSMPYLADVARLERVWLDAYHAADAEPLSPTSLAAIPPDDLPNARFVRHPAAAMMRSPYAAVTIFEANRRGQSGQRINAATPECGLITRPGMDVVIRPVSADDAVFITALIAGRTLAEAVVEAAAENEGFDLSAAIALLLTAGIFASVETV